MNRYGYVVNNPVRFNDPSGHMCSDPEDPTPRCDGSPLDETKVGDRVVRGQETLLPLLPNVPSIDEKYLLVLTLLAEDQTIADAWLRAYNTIAGREYAEFIYKHMVLMRWGPGPGSETRCDGIGLNCIIYFNPNLMPANMEFDLSPDLKEEMQKANELAVSIGHEGYQSSVASSHGGDSQFEEAMAYYVEDDIRFELTGIHLENYQGLFITSMISLRIWIDTYHEFYLDYPPYPLYP